MLGAGLVMMGATGVALAQAPQPPAGAPPATEAAPPPPPGGPGMHRPGMRGPGPMGGFGMMHGPGPHRFGPPPPPPSKAASFNFRNGDMRIHIRCAEDEPMQNCVNAASALIDKVSSMPAPAPAPAR
ncbi:hypothetical protein EBE87_06375 [Pseudoroseomonas wenyumeiae]|nr:hypothetical protein EBE87_06375 [Pseudoroseomonas wenyumeiae]